MAANAKPGALIMEPVGDKRGAAVTVQPGGPTTVGRSHDCEMRIDNPQVSKQHARLAWQEGAWYVTDLASHNGTTVNRWALTPHDPVILHDGDAVALGPCQFEVTIKGSAGRKPGSGTYATRGSIFLRLRDHRRDVQELGWEEFRKRYAPVIVGFCRNAGLPAQDAEDILQDVMLSFFRLSPQFEYDPSKGRFRGYLKRATLNAIRKRARGFGGGEAPLDDQWLDQEEAAGESEWDSHWSEQILGRALEEAQRRFDQQTWEAFELYGRRGVPAEQVATRLGITVNSVHQAKSRVLNLVKSVVARLHSDEG